MALFDAYLMVDWSAAAVPRLGADSIWLCHLRRDGAAMHEPTIENIPTRAAAHARLLKILEEDRAADRATLAGFDFPFGYPAGFAARLSGLERISVTSDHPLAQLRLSSAPPREASATLSPDEGEGSVRGTAWLAIWRRLSDLIKDAPNNANNRFDAAASINQALSGGAGPFWGCPVGGARPGLAARHHRRHDELGLAERRLVEDRLAGPQPTWKLYGNGSVGSQALTGIPIVHALRRQLGPDGAVWPFETGLAPLARRAGRAVFAEIYPSLVPIEPQPGEVKDSAQVRAIARHFAALDGSGDLAACFAGDSGLSPADRFRVETEEGWILGVTNRIGNHRRPHPPAGRTRTVASRRYAYLRDPAAIYAESFARIRRAVHLDRLPSDLHAIALRLVHAVGEPSIIGDLVWSPDAVAAGRQALARGAPILVDAEMVAAGIIRQHLPAANTVVCALGDERVPALARTLGTTRSAAAVECWRGRLGGAVVAIGNAPTALFHLLEMIEAGAPRPALVLGFPVGFVGAAEAKAALAVNRLDLPYIALSGRRGGSALAAAAVNALAQGDAPGDAG